MAITPQAGWEVDPNNPNAVRKIGTVTDPPPLSGIAYTSPADNAMGSYNTEQGNQMLSLGEAKAKGLVPSDTTAPVGGTASPSDYYPRYTQSEQGASDYLSTFQAPKTADELRTAKTTAAQGRIDALNKYYDSLVAEQSIVNAGRSRGTNAVSILSGLAGSTEANIADTKTSELNARDIGKVQNERAVAINEVLSGIETAAVEEAKQSRLEARQSAQDILKARADRQTQALEQIKTLAGSGVTFDGLKTTDPKSYDYLVRNAGGEQVLNALFTLNRPKEDIVSSQVLNGKYIVAYKNPLTNKISINTLDLGLPEGFSKAPVDAGDRLIFTPDNWDGDVSKLVAINKGLSPKDALDKTGGGVQGYNGDFEATIKTAAQVGGKTNQERALIEKNLKEFIAGKDYASAYTTILGAASSKLTGANASNFQQQQQAYSALSPMKDALTELHNAGYDTNILTGGVDKIQTKIGQLLTDPKYAAIAARLDSAFQQYRQNMTGAAFGAAESAEYASVLPNKGNSFALNLAKIDGAQQYLNSVIESTIRNTVGQGGVEIKKYAEGATPGSNQGKVLSKDGQSFDASDLSPEEYQQALKDGYVEQ